MKLKNKLTGEIATLTLSSDGEELLLMKDNEMVTRDVKLSDLDEWEDYEEPKEWWYIDIHGPHNVIKNDEYYQVVKEASKEIGNYFETREEAEQAVEKLKAVKRLRDKGFRFTAWKNGILLDETVAGQVRYKFPIDNKEDIEKDLDLLFSQEDD